MKLILGSKSINRKYILQKKGYNFEVVTADIDEKAIRDKDPRELVRKLAVAKAEKIAQKLNRGFLVTCDQVTLANNKILEKAKDLRQAEKFLKSYSNKKVENITGLAVMNLESKRIESDVDVTEIIFKNFDRKIIEQALADPYVLSYAAAAAFGKDIWRPYIKKVNGDKTALFGISVNLMEKLLGKVREEPSIRQSQNMVKKFSLRNHWRDVPNIDKIDHLHEELIEMSQYLRYKNERERILFVKENKAIFTDGIGDLLFGTLRLANQLGVDAQEAFDASAKDILGKYTQKNREHNIIKNS